MGANTLLGMLGKGITDRTRFQWVKTFGSENIFCGTSPSEPLIIDRDYIANVYYESVSQQRTTEGLANVMLYYYYRWASRPENSCISGAIAEEIHNRAMVSIAKYWNRKWAPEKHKSPAFGIFNLYNIIRRFVQADLLPNENTKYQKQRMNRWILDNTILLGDTTPLQVDAPHSPLSEWDVYHTETPIEILLMRERDDVWSLRYCRRARGAPPTAGTTWRNTRRSS